MLENAVGAVEDAVGNTVEVLLGMLLMSCCGDAVGYAVEELLIELLRIQMVILLGVLLIELLRIQMVILLGVLLRCY